MKVDLIKDFDRIDDLEQRAAMLFKPVAEAHDQALEKLKELLKSVPQAERPEVKITGQLGCSLSFLYDTGLRSRTSHDGLGPHRKFVLEIDPKGRLTSK